MIGETQTRHVVVSDEKSIGQIGRDQLGLTGDKLAKYVKSQLRKNEAISNSPYWKKGEELGLEGLALEDYVYGRIEDDQRGRI